MPCLREAGTQTLGEGVLFLLKTVPLNARAQQPCYRAIVSRKRHSWTASKARVRA